MIDLNKLEGLAKKASSGPWQECGSNRGGCICGQVWSLIADLPVATVQRGDEEIGMIPEPVYKANAIYIAAANPAVILELIETQRMMVEALKIADKFCGSHTPDDCDDSIHIPIRDALKRATGEST